MTHSTHSPAGSHSESHSHSSSRAEQTWDAAKSGVATSVSTGEDFVRSNPLGALLGAIAVGVAVGYLVSHREPTRRERYIDQPLEDLQSLVRTLADRATKQAGRGSDAAAGVVESLVERIKKNLSF